MSSSSPGSSTAQENNLFEKALARFDQDMKDRWLNVARAVGGRKSADEVKRNYDVLMEDLRRIEPGHLLVPNYRCPTVEQEKSSKLAN